MDPSNVTDRAYIYTNEVDDALDEGGKWIVQANKTNRDAQGLTMHDIVW